MTQDYLLARLLSNNAQWSEDVNAADSEFFNISAQGQSPKVLWIGCADSRVPESVVTASKPGEIFVHRNIANQFHPNDDSVLSVLTYAVEHVGVEHVVIVGHTNCGGAAACRDAASASAAASEDHEHGHGHAADSPLKRWLGPLTDLARALPEVDLTVLAEENVKMGVNNLAACDIIKRAWAAGKDVKVHGWLYELESGRLRDLNVSVDKRGTW